MSYKEIIEYQRRSLEAKEEEIRILKNRLDLLEKTISEGVEIEIHEYHTFATPEDIENLDFPNSKCSEDK